MLPKCLSSAARSWAIALFLAAWAAPAFAYATTQKDLDVGLRTIRFLKDKPSGRIEVAVLYDSQNRESGEDARAIFGWLKGNADTIGDEMIPSLIDIHTLGHQRRFALAVLAAGVSPDLFDLVFNYARQNQTLTVSSDMACVHAAKCTIGVISAPRVQVILSRPVSQASGLDFLEAFRMLVKEEN